MKFSRYAKTEIITTQPISQGNLGISNINDININNPLNGQILIYDGNDWINQNQPNAIISTNAPLIGDGSLAIPLDIQVDQPNTIAGLDANIRHNISDFNQSLSIYDTASNKWEYKHNSLTNQLSFLFNSNIVANLTNTGDLNLESTLHCGGQVDAIQTTIQGALGQTSPLLDLQDSSGNSLGGFLAHGGLFQKPYNATITSDSINISGYSNIVIDTEGAVANDYLSIINGGIVGQVIILRPINSSREIILIHNNTSLALRGGVNFRMHDARCFVVLVCVSPGNWYEIARNTARTEYKPISISGGIADITDYYTQDHKTSQITVDTEASAITDDLDTIYGGVEGAVIMIASISTSRAVIVKHGTGNIRLNGGLDKALNSTRDRLMLTYIANTVNMWVELSYSDNPV